MASLKMQPTEALGRQAFLQVVRAQRYYCLRKTASQASPVTSMGPLKEDGRGGAQAGSLLSPPAQSCVGYGLGCLLLPRASVLEGDSGLVPCTFTSWGLRSRGEPWPVSGHIFLPAVQHWSVIGPWVRENQETLSAPTPLWLLLAGNTLGRNPLSVPNVGSVTFGRRTSWSMKPGIA